MLRVDSELIQQRQQAAREIQEAAAAAEATAELYSSTATYPDAKQARIRRNDEASRIWLFSTQVKTFVATANEASDACKSADIGCRSSRLGGRHTRCHLTVRLTHSHQA